eukprot:1671357-Pyramimonas_sp.AAC.1
MIVPMVVPMVFPMAVPMGLPNLFQVVLLMAVSTVVHRHRIRLRRITADPPAARSVPALRVEAPLTGGQQR